MSNIYLKADIARLCIKDLQAKGRIHKINPQ